MKLRKIFKKIKNKLMIPSPLLHGFNVINRAEAV